MVLFPNEVTRSIEVGGTSPGGIYGLHTPTPLPPQPEKNIKKVVYTKTIDK